MLTLKQNKKLEIEDHLRFISKKGNQFRTLYWHEDKINRVIHLFVDFVGPPSNLKVLDLGCGTGTFTIALAKEGYSVVGVDLVNRLLRIANGLLEKENSRVSMISCDAENLPFKNGSFDVTFCSYTLHHFPVFHEALQEVNRVLSANGYLFALEANNLNPVTWYRHRSPKAREEIEVTSNEHPFGPRYLSRMLIMNGFTVLQLRSINFDFFEGLGVLEPYFEKIPVLNLFGGSLIALARKSEPASLQTP